MSRKKRNPVVAELPAEPAERQPQPQETDRPVEQSGDLQGLSDDPDAGPQSVRELTEEGQSFEAGVISGVENAPPADAGPIKVRRRPEDDVPPEYTDRVPDEPKE